jgi:ribonucleoside-triphosphate reductase
MIYHKKGEKLQVSIDSNIKYKVLTNNGYELPKTKEQHRYIGPMLSIILEDDKIAYDCIPEHECLIKIKNSVKEKKAKDLVPGDIFIDDNQNELKIKEVKSYSFDGIVYSFMMPSRNYYVNGILTKNCCRLRLDLRELTRKNGSLFGAGDNTGSIGVVTLNLPKLGYLSHNEKELFDRIESLMIIAKNSLERKRIKLTEWFDRGLFPYTKRYLKAKYDNHFSTIGLVGMNELCRNYFRNFKKKDWDISTKEGKALAIRILDFMRKKCSDFQEQTGNLYNLESTPAESTAYRLALHDKKKYPDIITAGSIANPYYTNSSNLPVNFSDNPWDSIEHQQDLQTKYTGGVVFHTFLNESIEDWTKVKYFLQKVMYNTTLPYITITPTFSHCAIHGFIKGNTNGVCPKCRDEAEQGYKKALTDLEDRRAKLLKEIEDNQCCDS